MQLLWALLERAAPASSHGHGHPHHPHLAMLSPGASASLEARTACALAVVSLAREPRCARALAGPVLRAAPRLLAAAAAVPLCAPAAALRRECLHAVYRLLVAAPRGSAEAALLVADCAGRAGALAAPPFTGVDPQYDGWAGLLMGELRAHQGGAG